MFARPHGHHPADRCIDCGSCIRVCPHKAIRSSGDSMEILKRFQCCVALPEPALYGQFQHLDSVDTVLNGLLKIGFHRVYEVAKAAEILSDYERQLLKESPPAVTPQISSACPTVLRLIRMRFPKLMAHVANTVLPMELAAILARREAEEATGLPRSRLGYLPSSPAPPRSPPPGSPRTDPSGAGRGFFHPGYLPAAAEPHAGCGGSAPPLLRRNYGPGLVLQRRGVRRPAQRQERGGGRH